MNRGHAAAFQRSFQRQVEHVEIYTHKHVWRIFQKVAAQRCHCAEDLRELDQGVAESVDRERFHAGKRDEPLSKHGLAADADE